MPTTAWTKSHEGFLTIEKAIKISPDLRLENRSEKLNKSSLITLYTKLTYAKR